MNAAPHPDGSGTVNAKLTAVCDVRQDIEASWGVDVMLRLAVAVTVLLTLGLSGCGDNSTASPTPGAPAGPPPRGIFISASDCAAANKISIEECGRAIDEAVVVYQQSAPAFKSLRSCEAALGTDRCTKNVDALYRARLQAFLVTMSKPASAIALSPPQGNGTTGFKSAEGAVAAFDDGYSISPSAQAVASDNSRLASD